MKPGFVNPRNGRLRLEIEMLLPADPQLAVDSQRARLDHRRIAVGDAERLGEKACRASIASSIVRIAGNGSYSSAHTRRPRARRVKSLAQAPMQPADGERALRREQRLVVTIRAAVSLAWDIRLRQHGHDAGLLPSAARQIEARHAARAHAARAPARREADAETADKIVDVQRLACDMAPCALMRQRRARFLHGRVLPLALLNEALRHFESVLLRAAVIAHGLQRTVQDPLHPFHGGIVPRLADDRAFRFDDPDRRRRDASKCEARADALARCVQVRAPSPPPRC